jgi:hypothetical protein
VADLAGPAHRLVDLLEDAVHACAAREAARDSKGGEQMNVNLSEVVATYSQTGLGALQSSGVSEERLNDFRSLMARAAAAVGRHASEVEKARRDRNLSPEGRAEKERKATKELRKAVAELRSETVEPLAKLVETRRAGMMEFGRLGRDMSRDEQMLAAIREDEIRRRLEAMDPVLMKAEYERASDEVKRAMENDPFRRLLDPAFITEQQERRSRELDPGSWTQMEAQELLGMTMNAGLTAVERALGVDEDAPLTEVA